jgi:hypothetical protein
MKVNDKFFGYFIHTLTKHGIVCKLENQNKPFLVITHPTMNAHCLVVKSGIIDEILLVCFEISNGQPAVNTRELCVDNIGRLSLSSKDKIRVFCEKLITEKIAPWYNERNLICDFSVLSIDRGVMNSIRPNKIVGILKKHDNFSMLNLEIIRDTQSECYFNISYKEIAYTIEMTSTHIGEDYFDIKTKTGVVLFSVEPDVNTIMNLIDALFPQSFIRQAKLNHFVD